MRAFVSSLPSGRALLALDLALAIWVAAWIWLGIAVGSEVSGLRRLSGTISKVGNAVQQSGQTLSAFDGVPFIGQRVGNTAKQIEQAGQSAVQSARASRDSAAHLSWMLALAIALIPSTPVLGLYVPARLIAIRERRALRRMWVVHGQEPEFRRLLARRALTALPYTRLARLAGPDPWLAFAAGEYDQLARAELERWGVDQTVLSYIGGRRTAVGHGRT